MSKSAHFEVVIREGCHLCEQFLIELRALQQQQSFSFSLQDVDQSTDLLQRYHDKVPVLLKDGEELCRYFLDPEQLPLL